MAVNYQESTLNTTLSFSKQSLQPMGPFLFLRVTVLVGFVGPAWTDTKTTLNYSGVFQGKK